MLTGSQIILKTSEYEDGFVPEENVVATLQAVAQFPS
jgi:hypothetical protein